MVLVFIVSAHIKEGESMRSFVTVVQSADLWQSHAGSYFWRLNGSWLGRVPSPTRVRRMNVTAACHDLCRERLADPPTEPRLMGEDRQILR
jgi:hypothetical protein